MRKIVVALLAVAMLSGLSFAQVKGGDIYGTVVLADGSKVPGVTVTLNGDVSGTKTTMSSEQGNFRFLTLAPGTYELKFELKGFKTMVRKDIQVSIGKSIQIAQLMETTTIEEVVNVTSKVGTIDTRKTTVGVNVSKEMVDSLPTARNPWTLLSAVPGVIVDRVDVGGADSGQQSNFLANGGDKDDTTWTIDGANVTDPSAIGAAPAYLNVNSYSELQVTVGSNDITAQTGGVQLNFVSKRAGNKVAGDFHLYVEDKKWEMNQTPTPYMVNRGLVIPGVNRLYQYGINLGGPIMKDKLWWFASYTVQDIHKRGETNVEDATLLTSASAKVNFQFGNTSGDIHYSQDNKQKWGRPYLSLAQQDTTSLWDQNGPGNIYYAGVSHVFGELMLNLKGVYTDGGFTLDPRGSNVNPLNGHEEGKDWKFVNNANNIEGSVYDVITNRNTKDISLDGNYFMEGVLGGDHEIKFGVDYYNGTTTSQTLFPNQRILYIYRDDPASNYIGIYPDAKVNFGFNRISAYAQDTMTLGKLTVAVGLRYDKEQGKINPLTLPGFSWYEPGSSHNGEAMYTDQIKAFDIASYKVPAYWALLSPRISLTYDLSGNGKDVLKLSAGRYMSQSGNSMAAHFLASRYAYASWDDKNGDEIPQYGEVGELFFTAPLDVVNPVTGMTNVMFADNYNTPYQDELTLTFEKAILSDLSVSITGFYKKRHNLAADQNSKGETSYTSKGYFMENGQVVLETSDNYKLSYVKVGGVDVPLYSRIDDPYGNYYYNYEKSYYRYLGGQVVISKKLSNRWMGTLSFTYQDNKKHLDKSDLVDYNNYDFFNDGQVAPSSTGSGNNDVWMNSRWIVKFTGMYQLPFGINFTTFFQAKEGNPQPLRRKINDAGQGTVYLYRVGYKAGDERLPALYMLNLGLEKTFKVSDSVNATLVIDWYNALNAQIETKRALNIAAAAKSTDGAPTQWTNAGLFQFGVRVNF